MVHASTARNGGSMLRRMESPGSKEKKPYGPRGWRESRLWGHVDDLRARQAYISAMPEPVIVVRNLAKRYGRTVAVADVSLEVREGEIFGLIGPNGAGKTTTMECIEGLRRPDAGTMTRARPRPAPRRDRAAPAHRRAAPGGAAPEAHQGVGGGRSLGVALRQRARRRRRRAARAARPHRASATRGS